MPGNDRITPENGVDKEWQLCYNIQALKGATQYRGVEQLEARRAHNPEVVGSSPASATIKNTGFRKKSGVFLTFQPKMEVPKPSIGVSLGLCATCTKEKTELF